MIPSTLAKLLSSERKEVLIACAMAYLYDIATTLDASERAHNEPKTRIHLNVAWALDYSAMQILEENDDIEWNEVQFYEFAQLLLQELVERCTPG
jgi:putative IMPACT (imprinted ancient) family translation regulator